MPQSFPGKTSELENTLALELLWFYGKENLDQNILALIKYSGTVK